MRQLVSVLWLMGMAALMPLQAAEPAFMAPLAAKARLYDLADGMSARVGSRMSNNQLVDLVLLHELAHSYGNTHPSGDADLYDSRIWNNCFR